MRPTLRLRLTLLYGGCFIVAGAGLLGITYALFAHGTVAQRPYVGRATLELPNALIDGGKVLITTRGGVGIKSSAPRPSTKLVRNPPRQMAAQASPPFVESINQLRSAGQRQFDRVIHRANAALTGQRRDSLASLLTESGIALAIMALLSIGLGWLLAGRALRPLRIMNTRARAITEDTLDERLGLEGRRDELGELSATLDAVLARLERAFDSQRRFVANASHELRTPITLERALLEVALADPDAGRESLRETCERVLVVGEQQERVIDALLTLARGQAGLERSEPVDLGGLVEELVEERAPRMAGIAMETRLEPAPVSGDPALLERLVANLLDNAIIHNRAPKRWIRVETSSVDGRAELRVANSGGPIAPERVQDLFEPFHRLEEERTSRGGGLGLGLSIVRAIAVAHGGEVQARALPGGGFEVQLRLASRRAAASEGPGDGGAVPLGLEPVRP